MVSLLLVASLLTAEPPDPAPAQPKPAKPTPEQRLAKLDHARLELHLGIRGYGRFLSPTSDYGGSVQLGAGVRVVRGLYLVGELGVGAHAMPVGAAGQLLVGVQHELRLTRWVRPTFALGYSHLIDATSTAGFDASCDCLDLDDPDLDVSGHGEVRIAQRDGLQVGLGLRFPMRWAPRLSVYVRGDAAYYFDPLPGRLQIGGGGGLQIVF